MFCARDCPSRHGGDVHGYEQCAIPGGARDPQDEGVADKSFA